MRNAQGVDGDVRDKGIIVTYEGGELRGGFGFVQASETVGGDQADAGVAVIQRFDEGTDGDGAIALYICKGAEDEFAQIIDLCQCDECFV